ncbi:MAG: hypothetical protein KAU22_05835 [Desulfuromonadales bacterium]|nr:hypothetical protein [Desulfuromonadales bacterium]
MVDARKNRIEPGQAWDIVKDSKIINVAKGKKVVRFDAIINEQEEVLKKIMGPSGNLRAPTLRVGDEYVVGFNLELYEERFK